MLDCAKWCVVALSVLLSFPCLADGRVPDVIEAATLGAPPLWVAAEVAITQDGTLDERIVGPAGVAAYRRWERSTQQHRERLHRAGRNPARDECLFSTGRGPTHAKPTSTADDLVTNAERIVSGRVTELRQGFFLGQPGSLASLVDIKVANDTSSDEEPLFVFVPQAKIDLAFGVVCADLGSGNFRLVPGDRIVAFSMQAPYAGDGYRVIAPDVHRELVVQSREHGLKPPRAFPIEQFDSIDRIECAVGLATKPTRSATST